MTRLVHDRADEGVFRDTLTLNVAGEMTAREAAQHQGIRVSEVPQRAERYPITAFSLKVRDLRSAGRVGPGHGQSPDVPYKGVMQNAVIENDQLKAIARKYARVGQYLGRARDQFGMLDLNQDRPGLQPEFEVRRVDDRPAPAIPRPLKKVFFRWKPAPSYEVERHRLCPRAHDARVKTEGSTRARFKPAFVGRQLASRRREVMHLLFLTPLMGAPGN